MALPSLLQNTARIKESRAALVQARRTDPNLRLPGQDRRAALLGAATPKDAPFAETERELAAEYIGRKSNRSISNVKDVMPGVVKAGFAQRLDFARGGKGGQEKARYRATIPDWVQPYGSAPDGGSEY